jgi:hypothetical protein
MRVLPAARFRLAGPGFRSTAPEPLGSTFP